MIYSVKISGPADEDLRSIYEYIAYELCSVQNASAQFFRLKKEILSLQQMPERYRRYEKEPWFSKGWRIMTVDRYCVFYLPDHEQRIVTITRVLYGGRDLSKALGSP